MFQELNEKLEELLSFESDENFGLISEELKKNFEVYLTGPEITKALDGVITEGDRQGYTVEQYTNELQATYQQFEENLNNFIEKYNDQPNKLRFCMEFGQMIYAFIVSAISYIAEKVALTIKIELCHPKAKIPTYAHDTDWGADIYAVEDMVIEPGSFGVMVPTGLIVEIPRGYELAFRPRSGMSHKTPLRLSNSPGTIDADYRGELKVLFDNFSNIPVEIKAGDRIVQAGLEKCYKGRYVKYETVNKNTDRGEGGFGSSGN